MRYIKIVKAKLHIYIIYIYIKLKKKKNFFFYQNIYKKNKGGFTTGFSYSLLKNKKKKNQNLIF